MGWSVKERRGWSVTAPGFPEAFGPSKSAPVELKLRFAKCISDGNSNNP